MSTVTIGSRKVGHGLPPYVVAEAGINHNGNVDTALQMIAVAKKAGVDAVKFQTFKADEVVTDRTQQYTYQSQGETITESMLDMFQRCELTIAEWKRIRNYCDEVGITFLSTPQNRSDLDILMELGVSAIKVGSDDFVNLPLLRDYASTGLPLILSCGMADMEEVRRSLETIGAADGYPVVLLLCTSQYPTPPEDVNLLKFKTLAGAFPDLPLGFSDHTQSALASSLAVAFGACLFEKHFTLDHGMPGPDHWFSEDTKGLTEWVGSIRTAYSMMGDAVVRPTDSEKEMRKIAHRSVVAIKDIPVGAVLDTMNLGLRRPGTGMPSSMLDSVLGKHAKFDLSKGHLLQVGDFQ
jgi:sialic acid synthase SpsE